MKKVNFGQKLLDYRWKASDQLIQLKGLVEFDERYKYWIGLKNEIEIKERDEELKRFTKSIHILRSLLKKHKVAAYDAIQEVLKQDKEIYLICRDLEPQGIVENQKQMVFRKKLAVDKTRYEIKKKEDQLYDIQSELGVGKEKIIQDEQVVRNKEIEEREQFSAALEYSKTQKDVCRITMDSYEKLLGILKKDSCYFDDLLDMLKEDSLVQSNAILRMMTLGQMLSEDFSWLKNEAKKHALSFNSASRDTRKEIQKISTDMKALDRANSKLKEYAAYGYSLFQEKSKESKKSEEKEQLKTTMTELNLFIGEWKKSLNVGEQPDFFPKLFKIHRMHGELLKRMKHIEMLKDFQQNTSDHLGIVLAEFQNNYDDEVRKYLEEIFDIENEIHSTVKEMQDLKKEEDSVNTDLELYKNDIYQFKRMLSHIFIGPPFGGDIEGGSDIGVQMDAINRLRHDQPEFHCSTDSEDEAHTKEYDLEAIARPYLDPNVEFDFKKTTADTNNICEIDIIEMFDNVLMQMRTVQEALGPDEMSREPTEEELISLGDLYAENQADIDHVIEESMYLEKLNYKKFKPRYDDYRKKTCLNKSRLDVKFESQRLVFENEGPVVGMIINKGALHPPGVIRGMYVPETDSEEEEENPDEKKEAAAGAKEDNEDEEAILEEVDQSSSAEEDAYSDLDPDQPKPHICF